MPPPDISEDRPRPVKASTIPPGLLDPLRTLALDTRFLFETHAFILPSAYYAYAVTADGQRFLVAETLEGPESPPLTVVVGWLAALRR